ncbi:alpha/beta hydrolase [Pontibacter sp. MBLB2868]|uniref:alpha/beta hydrolase n=1 Tax=Pontibacter sp. MBLB2868 TaxID=3451555 RepID=UPI003F751F49
MKQLILLCHFICFILPVTAFAQIPHVSAGQIKRLENFNSKYVAPRNVDVWLPASYNPGKKYAVVYMHDGQMLFDSTLTWNNQEWGVDETMSRLMQENKIEDCIVVGIWNSGKSRHSDYFPQKPFESLPQDYQDQLTVIPKGIKEMILFSSGVQSDKYLKFLVTELKPYIDSTFSTKPDRENTFILGSSMGGLVSAYAICEYPEVFGGAACLSTHWIGTFTTRNNPIPAAFMAYLKENLPSPETHRIYFDYGTETLDALYEPYQKQVDEIMKEKGYTSQSWITKKFEGEDHSERAWRKRLATPVRFLLGNKKGQ